MSVKIGIIGNIQGISHKKIGNLSAICLEVVAKGIAHQNVDNIFKEVNVQSIHYSVLLQEKLFNNFKKLTLEDILSDNNKLIGAQVYIQGVPTLDLPMTVIEGEVGIIAYEIDIVGSNHPDLIEFIGNKKKNQLKLKKKVYQQKVRISELLNLYWRKRDRYRTAISLLQQGIENLKNTRERIDQHFQISLAELQIFDYFADPKPEKVDLAINHYNVYQKFPAEIVVKLVNGRWFICDGYSIFIAAKTLGHIDVMVKNIVYLIPEGVSTNLT